MTGAKDVDIYEGLPASRSDIAALSRTARQAVLSPAAPGGWPVAWRHAVAARICTVHGQQALARDYAAGADTSTARLADPACAGEDAHERAVLAFIDKVAARPRLVTAGDVEALKAAGVAEADIVRLCELAAYLAYECRVAAGLALLREVGR